MASTAEKSSFEAPNQEIVELFGDYLTGDTARPALAISERELSDSARTALERSFEAFGFEAPTCTYATLMPKSSEAEGGDIALDPHALFLLVESLDPLFVVAADKAAADSLGRAYRTDLPRAEAAAARLFGRPLATFADLAQLLNTETGKQKAWRALKALNV